MDPSIILFRYKLKIVGGMGPTVGLVSCRLNRFDNGSQTRASFVLMFIIHSRFSIDNRKDSGTNIGFDWLNQEK